MNPQEELLELEEEVKDCEKKTQRSEKEAKQAIDWFKEAKLEEAQAIIKLDKFKKDNNIK